MTLTCDRCIAASASLNTDFEGYPLRTEDRRHSNRMKVSNDSFLDTLDMVTQIRNKKMYQNVVKVSKVIENKTHLEEESLIILGTITTSHCLHCHEVPFRLCLWSRRQGMMKNVSKVPKMDKRSDVEVERSAGHLRILMASPGGGKLNHFSELYFFLNFAL